MRALEPATAAAVAYLLRAQDREGLWPDFNLEPGPSDAWTSACVAFALAEIPVVGDVFVPLRRASDALHRLRTPHGWGYNFSTAADADSTAWTLRFLARVDDLREVDGHRLLCKFLDDTGGVHTFRGERFGSWSGVHADVAPVVSLAFRAIGVDNTPVRTPPPSPALRTVPHAPWRAFWWTCDAYAVARNLELRLDGPGASPDLTRQVADWITCDDPPNDAFALSQLLACAAAIEHPTVAQLVALLLERQLDSGGWPGTTRLRVPPQHINTGDRDRGEMGGALFVTAMALMSLKRAQTQRAARNAHSWR